MSKRKTGSSADDLRRGYDIASLKGGIRGKYFKRAQADITEAPLVPKVPPRVRNGVPLMPRRKKGSQRATMEQVNRLRDEP